MPFLPPNQQRQSTEGQIKILQTRKTGEINLLNAIPKTFKMQNLQ